MKDVPGSKKRNRRSLGSSREIRDILQQLRKAGWTVRSGKTHVTVLDPSGDHTVTISKTASDGRAIANIRADLKRAGWDA